MTNAERLRAGRNKIARSVRRLSNWSQWFAEYGVNSSMNARPLQNAGRLNETASRLRLTAPRQRPHDHIGQDGRDRPAAAGKLGIEPPGLAQHVENILFSDK